MASCPEIFYRAFDIRLDARYKRDGTPRVMWAFDVVAFQEDVLGYRDVGDFGGLSKPVRYATLYLVGKQVTVRWEPGEKTFTVSGKYGKGKGSGKGMF